MGIHTFYLDGEQFVFNGEFNQLDNFIVQTKINFIKKLTIQEELNNIQEEIKSLKKEISFLKGEVV